MNILERIYVAGCTVKRRRDSANIKRLPCKVVSIGNITLGGTGKTPAVMAFAKEALNRGFLNPTILTRAYKAKKNGLCFISKGNGALLNVREAGDEPFLMASKLTGVTIVKGSDRYSAGLLAPDSDLFILDDGFQHWKLFRDIDVLLIDGMRGLGNCKTLPLGRLREPVTQIKRADVIVITRKETSSAAQKNVLTDILNTCPDKSILNDITEHIYTAAHKPCCLVNKQWQQYSLEQLKGRRVFLFCAIGNPDAFISTVKRLDYTLCGFKFYKDHYNYRYKDAADLLKLAKNKNADFLLTTEKDLIKIGDLIDVDSIFALSIEFNIVTAFYDYIFKRLSSDC
ncbi:Tetraacyldisaccharide-1-P 4'-kinase [Candidatus Magnetoovum chiemensis]|nr:Tetraacyldisaccharide-1-P 4'-kinase [Candidatus Magnetoovum chiemensis]